MEIAKPLLILDFGSQTTHLILRRLRAENYFCELLPCNAKISEWPKECAGVILSGSPYSVYEKDAPKLEEEVWNYIKQQKYKVNYVKH